jgi:hypothetical protein
MFDAWLMKMAGKRAAKKPKAPPPIEGFCQQLADALSMSRLMQCAPSRRYR